MTFSIYESTYSTWKMTGITSGFDNVYFVAANDIKEDLPII